MSAIARRLAAFLMALMALGPAAQAAETFRRVTLPYGISLDVPGDWHVMPAEDREEVNRRGQTRLDSAGIGKASQGRESLLLARAQPEPTGALIRVAVRTPGSYSQAQLAALTPADFERMRDEALLATRKLEAAGGPTVLDMQLPRVEAFNDRHALVQTYVRTSEVDGAPWEVTFYRIPQGEHTVEFSLSYRRSEESVWRPVLEKVKRSVRF